MISFILAGEMIQIISNVSSRNREPIREDYHSLMNYLSTVILTLYAQPYVLICL